MNDINNASQLLSQLQRRLFALGKSASTTAMDQQQLYTLLAMIFQSQQQGNGVVSIAQISTAGLSLESLQAAFPLLIGNTTSVQTPIVVFAPFVAFRRRYQEMQSIVDYLHRQSGRLSPPSTAALKRIAWDIPVAQSDRAEIQHVSLNSGQQLAALTAASVPFAIITGGAGTGKTTTLAKALELILLDHPNAVIQLAAPTGKAARRMNDALQQQFLGLDADVRPVIAELRAQTVHRLLGISEQTGKAYHHAGNLLRCDVLAIDEASMVGGDLFLMVQAALLPHTKLLLLGDANQLPAIDSLPFFNDISRLPVGYTPEFCQVAESIGVTLTPQPAPLANQICHLTVANRYAADSVVGRCAEAVLAGDVPALLDAIQPHWDELTPIGHIAEHLCAMLPKQSEALLSILSQRMVLCANRQGREGSERINYIYDQYCRQVFEVNQRWYVGRRIMIERNDSALNLSNGDIGVCEWRDQSLVVVFEGERYVPVDDMPNDYSLAFAMSIHKSQGSEYQHVDVVLGRFNSEEHNPLVSPELLYTAITRAKQSLHLYADEALLYRALSKPSDELSPLQVLLRASGTGFR